MDKPSYQNKKTLALIPMIPHQPSPPPTHGDTPPTTPHLSRQTNLVRQIKIRWPETCHVTRRPTSLWELLSLPNVPEPPPLEPDPPRRRASSPSRPTAPVSPLSPRLPLLSASPSSFLLPQHRRAPWPPRAGAPRSSLPWP